MCYKLIAIAKVKKHPVVSIVLHHSTVNHYQDCERNGELLSSVTAG